MPSFLEKRKLLLLAQKPPYKIFSIPKKGGGERQIEAPGADLKNVLRKLYLGNVSPVNVCPNY